MSLNDLIRPDQLAKALGVALPTVYFWCRRGLIPHMKLAGVVRFEPDEIAEWLYDRRIPARKIDGSLLTVKRQDVTT